MKKIEKQRIEDIKSLFDILSKIESNEPLVCFNEMEEEIYTTSIYLKGIIEDFLSNKK